MCSTSFGRQNRLGAVGVSFPSRQLWRKPVVANQVRTRSVFSHERRALVLRVSPKRQHESRRAGLRVPHHRTLKKREVTVSEYAWLRHDFRSRKNAGDLLAEGTEWRGTVMR